MQVDVMNRAMSADQLPSARQIRKAATRTEDLFSMFDAIVYGKGAAVIAMFERYVGEDVFREGMRRYVAEHAHGTTTSADFLSAIATAAGSTVFTPAFETFLEQPGLPSVALELSCDGAPKLSLEQSRYVPAGAEVEGAPRWQIPICVRYDAGGDAASEKCALMRERELTIELDKDACPRWVFANAGGRGYYRSEYRGELLAGLFGATAHLTTAERVNLLHDLGAALGAGRIPIGEVLGLLPKLMADDSWFVLKGAVEITAGARALVPVSLSPNYGRFLVEVLPTGRS
jgi:alanyl aminopeptidase